MNITLRRILTINSYCGNAEHSTVLRLSPLMKRREASTIKASEKPRAIDARLPLAVRELWRIAALQVQVFGRNRRH
jgi:hypothetical protein